MNILEPQIEYLLLLQNFREFSGHIFDGFFINVTMFGEIILPFLFVALMYWCIDKKCGIYLMFNLYFAMLLNQFIKLTACIYRPWILDSRVKPLECALKMATGYSFPSGHTAIAAGVWGGTAVCFWNNKFLRYFLVALVLFVALSRNYLGVHTPQDVIISLLLGVFILISAKKLIEWIDKGKNRDLVVFGAITLLLIILVFYTELKSYPIDYINGNLLVDPVKMKFGTYPKSGFIFGAFQGWLLERRFVNFNAHTGSIVEKVIRYFVGAVILVILVYKTEFVFISFIGRNYGIFLNNIIAGLFVTVIYPYLISLCSKIKTDMEVKDA